MKIQSIEKRAYLTGLVDGRRLRGRYDVVVDEYQFPSMLVLELHVNRGVPSPRRVFQVLCDLQSRSFPRLVEAALDAGNCEVVLVDVEDGTRASIRVNAITTELRIKGLGVKTHEPGQQFCSLRIDEQEIAQIKVDFPDISGQTPIADLLEMRDEDEKMLFEAIAANRECYLLCDSFPPKHTP